MAIFFLLRTRKPDAYERQTRRALAGKRESSVYEVPLGPHGMRAKFKNLFGFGKKREGWVRANSGDFVDEWDASDESRPGHGQARELTDRDVRMVTSPTSGHAYIPQPLSTPPQQLSRKQMERNATSDSVELSVPDGHPSPPPVDIPPSIPRPIYSDPYVTSPTSPTEHYDRPHGSSGNPSEQFSVQTGSGDSSLRSMQKLGSGTKFVESLEF